VTISTKFDMSGDRCEGTIYVKINNDWRQYFCWTRNGKFQAFDKQSVVSVSENTKREAVLNVCNHIFRVQFELSLH
jgi:hypothetical protein